MYPGSYWGFGSNRQDTYVFWGLLKWRPHHFHPGLATIIVCSTAQMAQDYDENETVYRGRRDGL